MEANETNGKEIEEYAVRPSATWMLKMMKMEQQQKKILEISDEVSKEDVEIRRLIEERRNTPKDEKQRLKNVSKQIRNASETRKELKGKNRFKDTP